MTVARWLLRLENFLSALALLEEAIARVALQPDDELVAAGTVQRFEICWELGWKVLRDYLFYAGSPVEVPVPINVIRAAFQAGLISDGDKWVSAMRARNEMSHVYDPVAFRKTVSAIREIYFPLLQALETRMTKERDAAN